MSNAMQFVWMNQAKPDLLCYDCSILGKFGDSNIFIQYKTTKTQPVYPIVAFLRYVLKFCKCLIFSFFIHE